MLGTGADARALPVIRIVAPEGNYDYQNKYFTDDTKYLVPCGLPEGEEQAIQDIVLKAYRVLGCRGWGRLDVMIDAATRDIVQNEYAMEVIRKSDGKLGIKVLGTTNAVKDECKELKLGRCGS